jgi:hypothetical protein
MKTIDQLVDENTGYGFFGTAAQTLGYRQAGEAYLLAVHTLEGMGFAQEDAEKLMTSKMGRWWAEQLDWRVDYGNIHERRKAVAAALKQSRMDAVKLGRETLRNWQD